MINETYLTVGLFRVTEEVRSREKRAVKRLSGLAGGFIQCPNSREMTVEYVTTTRMNLVHEGTLPA